MISQSESFKRVRSAIGGRTQAKALCLCRVHPQRAPLLGAQLAQYTCGARFSERRHTQIMGGAYLGERPFPARRGSAARGVREFDIWKNKNRIFPYVFAYRARPACAILT